MPQRRSEPRRSLSGVKTRALILLVALMGIGFLIQKLQSPEFEQGLKLFWGASEPLQLTTSGPWDWCPEKTKDILVVQFQKKIKAIDEVQAICKVEVGPVEQDWLKEAEWSVILIAQSESGLKSVLEFDSRHQIFRSGGLPFKSESLTQAYQKHAQP